MRHVPFIDSSGIHNFRETIKYLKVRNVKIILSGVQPGVKKELEKTRIDFLIGRNNICDNYIEAKAKALKVLD